MYANQRVGFLGESYAVVRTEPESQLGLPTHQIILPVVK
jgi:hypothetical protein